MILGLDASTATVGVSVLDMEGNVIFRDFLSLKKLDEIVHKGDVFDLYIRAIKEEYPIQHVFIEDYAQKMSKGSSSAYTITRLAAWNGIVQFACYKVFDVVPQVLNVNEARKACGIKVLSKKKCGLDGKSQVFEWVTKNVKGMENPKTKVISSGSRKGVEVVIDEASDMTDAWVIAYAGFKGVILDK